jgi:hypothetical protein
MRHVYYGASAHHMHCEALELEGDAAVATVRVCRPYCTGML